MSDEPTNTNSLGRGRGLSAADAVSYWQGTQLRLEGLESGLVLVSLAFDSALCKSSCQRRKRSLAFLETMYSLGQVVKPCSSAKALAPSPTKALGGTRLRLRGLLLVSRMSFAREIGFLMSTNHVNAR